MSLSPLRGLSTGPVKRTVVGLEFTDLFKHPLCFGIEDFKPIQLESEFLMRIKQSTAILVASTLMLAQGCGKSTEDEGQDSGYEIVLFRPMEPGFKFIEHSPGEYEMHEGVYINSEAIEESTTGANVDLVTEAEVLATDSKGRATRMRYSLQSIRSRAGTIVPPSLTPGTVIEASAIGGDKVHDGIPADTGAELKQLLETLLSVGDPDDPTEDEYMGTKSRMDVGDTWSIDFEEFRRQLGSESSSVSLSGATLKGYAQLNEIREVGGILCLLIQYQFAAEGIQVAVPPGTQVISASLTTSFLTAVPEDPTLPAMSAESHLFLNIQLKTNNGVEIYRTITQNLTTIFEYPTSSN